MGDDVVWLANVLAGVRSDLEVLCSRFGVLNVCGFVLESVAEVFPTWFSGRRRRVLVASIVYLSLLIARGARKGFLKQVLDLCGASKPAVRDAVSRFAFVDWDAGFVYLDPNLYESLSRKMRLPQHVKRYTISDFVKNRIWSYAPGLYQHLEVVCMRNSKKDCITLLFENPDEFKNILLSIYKTPLVAKLVAEKLFTPIAEALQIAESPQKLAEKLFTNPEDVAKLLKQMLNVKSINK